MVPPNLEGSTTLWAGTTQQTRIRLGMCFGMPLRASKQEQGRIKQQTTSRPEGVVELGMFRNA